MGKKLLKKTQRLHNKTAEECRYNSERRKNRQVASGRAQSSEEEYQRRSIQSASSDNCQITNPTK